MSIYDENLLAILGREGSIDKFLDIIFGFLSRRTDFYKICKSPNDKVGFPNGVAQLITKNAFLKYQKLEDITGKPITNLSNDNCKSIESQDMPSTKNENFINRRYKNLSDLQTIQLSGNPEQDQVTFQQFPESYNGAIRERYVWTQTQNDLDVRVYLPHDDITSHKDITVTIKPKLLRIERIKRNLNEKNSILSGELFAEIKPEESIWSLIIRDRHIHINLEKKVARMWLSLLKGEPSISVKDLELVQNMEDLVEEEQNTVERLLHDETQKAMGLPTSQQKDLEKKLKDAWNMPGSPFIGQPFDISKVNISGTNNF